MSSKCRVLVTGATGFLGKNVLLALAARGDLHVIAACRSAERLPAGAANAVRIGDLRDPGYRGALVEDVDVICHCGTWGAFWGHAKLERERFFEPARDLMERAVERGVERFIQNSAVVVAPVRRDGGRIEESSPAARAGVWPHLDRLADLEHHMRALRGRGTRMIVLRLGHFLGRGNGLGMLSALLPRLRTGLVPWLAGGRSRLPLVADTDLGRAFALAATATGLDDFETFNICGPSFPRAREVIELMAERSGASPPRVSVPFSLGYAFGWLMEKLHPILPGRAPFLTRSIVHVSEDWFCATEGAEQKLGYRPEKDWRVAALESLDEIAQAGYPWPKLSQVV